MTAQIGHALIAKLRSGGIKRVRGNRVMIDMERTRGLMLVAADWMEGAIAKAQRAEAALAEMTADRDRWSAECKEICSIVAFARTEWPAPVLTDDGRVRSVASPADGGE